MSIKCKFSFVFKDVANEWNYNLITTKSKYTIFNNVTECAV